MKEMYTNKVKSALLEVKIADTKLRMNDRPKTLALIHDIIKKRVNLANKGEVVENDGQFEERLKSV